MKPVQKIEGKAAPLDRSDVDTDQIIPAVWLKRVERTGFGEGLFSSWREKDPNFVLNQPEYRGAKILVAGPNFGVGSSREHAVWALMDYGFEAVISPRFGDIFRNNATKNGLVPVVVPNGFLDELLAVVENDPSRELVVDVARKTVGIPSLNLEMSFPLDDFTQQRFMEGLDDIALTLRHEADITAYEAQRADWLPRVEAAS